MVSKSTALQNLAPNHTCLGVSSNPEDLDYLDQVCLIRVGAELCKAVALQELSLRPLVYTNVSQSQYKPNQWGLQDQS